jgi:hypothetical protein
VYRRDVLTATAVRLIRLVRRWGEGCDLRRGEDVGTPFTHGSIHAHDGIDADPSDAGDTWEIVEDQIGQMCVVDEDFGDTFLVPRCGVDEGGVVTASQPDGYCADHAGVAASPQNYGACRPDDAHYTDVTGVEELFSAPRHGALGLAERVGDARPGGTRIDLQCRGDTATEGIQSFSTIFHVRTSRTRRVWSGYGVALCQKIPL